MKQVNGKWVITGDVLNPVSGYELITYDAMDWFMGVSSVDDMMARLRLNRRGFPNSTSARKHIRHGPNISSAWWTTTSFRKTSLWAAKFLMNCSTSSSSAIPATTPRKSWRRLEETVAR